jgi:hypothetical protein
MMFSSCHPLQVSFYVCPSSQRRSRGPYVAVFLLLVAIIVARLVFAVVPYIAPPRDRADVCRESGFDQCPFLHFQTQPTLYHRRICPVLETVSELYILVSLPIE